MVAKDTELVNAFLADFVKKLTSRYPDEIDFILLFGSAARGEFRAGTSDVDLIIQLKDEGSVAKVEGYAEKVFWELDRKHGTRLYEVCSTKRDDILGMLERQAKLYKPFEVLGPDDIRWGEGRIDGERLGVFAALAPVEQFAKKVKREGKILHGRDILKEMVVKETLLGKLKAIVTPYLLSLSAMPLSIIMPDKALRYSVKATLYSVDEQLTLLDSSQPKRTSLKMRMLRAELGEYYSVRLAKEALQARRDPERTKKEWSYVDKVSFCFQAPFYIFHNNMLSLAGFLHNRLKGGST